MCGTKKHLLSILLSFLMIVTSGCGANDRSTSLTEVEANQSVAETPVEEEGSHSIYVYVCGQVNQPGVYELPEGSRVYQAIEAAGGIKAGAASEAINQAEALSDGQKIYIPTIEEQETTANVTGSAAAPDDGKVHLNSADKNELMTLAGIGESKAESIINYREEHGAFGTVEELMNVAGIKEGTFSKINDDIAL